MPEYLVQHYADNCNTRFPDKPAVSTKGMTVTFRELLLSSNQMANCLIENDVARQDRVCFCLQRSPRCVISLLGILKADAIYVPIDPKAPQDRAEKIINDCTPKAVICDSHTLARISQSVSQIKNPPKVLAFESLKKAEAISHCRFVCQEEIAEFPSDTPDYQNVDTDIAYILYTSGSTGNPKGVMISHLNIRNYVDWAVECFGITHDDKILNSAPFHFDMSVFDIFTSLKAGARLCVVPDGFLLFPSALIKYIEEEETTIWKAIASLLMYVARTGSLQNNRLPSLKKILFSGEPLHPKYLIEWMRLFPDKLFFNAYGPTEATGISTYYHVKSTPSSERESVPIGKPCANTELFLLKDDGSQAKAGEVGELYIRGSGLSRGYWNDPGKTQSVFVQNPLGKISSDTVYQTGDLAVVREDGNYEFLGRKDDQIKFMGYRIECDEIKNALISMPKIRDAVVLLLSQQNSDLQDLVAFVEGTIGLEKSEVTNYLLLHLPHYMIPTKVFFLPVIPRNDRGKVDKSQLRVHYYEAANNYQETPLQRAVVN
jgi:amino acid adenylation domain-containing protein